MGWARGCVGRIRVVGVLRGEASAFEPFPWCGARGFFNPSGVVFLFPREPGVRFATPYWLSAEIPPGYRKLPGGETSPGSGTASVPASARTRTRTRTRTRKGPKRQGAGSTRRGMTRSPVGCPCRTRRYRDRYLHRNRNRSGASAMPIPIPVAMGSCLQMVHSPPTCVWGPNVINQDATSFSVGGR